MLNILKNKLFKRYTQKDLPPEEDFIERYRDTFKEKDYQISKKNDQFYIEGNGLKILGKAANTLWTAEGVLCQNDYDFQSKDNFLMIDIGLNIGITSLSMARKKNITKIYGYEPFKPTFDQALKNLEINPVLAKKIRIFNYGLGKENSILKINYNPDLPGSMSSFKNKFEEQEQVEEITIKKSSKIISEIIKNKEEKVFLKIDCEGAEHDIFEDLNSSNLLKKIDVIVAEWHFKIPQRINQILESNGFIVFNKEIVKDELGLIKAVRLINYPDNI